MSESSPNKSVTDEDLVGASTEISLLSRHLVMRLIHLNQIYQSQKGGKQNEQYERNGNGHQGLRVIVYSISDIPNWLIGTFNSAKEVALAVELEKHSPSRDHSYSVIKVS